VLSDGGARPHNMTGCDETGTIKIETFEIRKGIVGTGKRKNDPIYLWGGGEKKPWSTLPRKKKQNQGND